MVTNVQTPRNLTDEERALLLNCIMRAAASWASIASEAENTSTAVQFASRADQALDLWALIRTGSGVAVTP